MDTYGAESFFPEREVVRARRLRATVDVSVNSVPVDPSEARARRMATSVTASVAAFTPIFVNAVVFGWITYKSALEVLVCAISCVLVGAGALAAVNLRSGFLRAGNRRS
jgi:hypothetical protein